MYKIIFYRDKNGNSEIEEYLQELRLKTNSKDARIKFKKILTYIKLLMKDGLNLVEPYIKYIGEDIWEMRPLRERIFFAYIGENKFILLNHFMKQTNTTPRREIEKAIGLLREYKKRR